MKIIYFFKPGGAAGVLQKYYINEKTSCSEEYLRNGLGGQNFFKLYMKQAKIYVCFLTALIKKVKSKFYKEMYICISENQRQYL